MAIAHGRSDLHAEIEDLFFALERMVDEVPELIRKSFQEIDNHIQEEARQLGEGDKEVESSTYNTLYGLYGMDGKEVMTDNLYKAIAVAIYNTYEMSVGTVAKLMKCVLPKRPTLKQYAECLEMQYNLILKPQSDVQEIFEIYREFRNLIAHNLYDPEEVKRIKELLQDRPGIFFTEDAMVIKSPKYLLESIEQMRNIMVELVVEFQKRQAMTHE